MSFFNHHEKKSLHRTSLKLAHEEQTGKLSAYSEKKQVKNLKNNKHNNNNPVVTNFLGNISE